MQTKIIQFSNRQVELCFDVDLQTVLSQNSQASQWIWITDSKLPVLYPDFFVGKKYIPVVAEESQKIQSTIDGIILQLLQWNVDKQHVLAGIGGGIITDITGYTASIYKRGIGCVLVPTSILAMVDAAVGGKNGVNAGAVKNMVGTIYQPRQILYDFQFLKSLPRSEWVNGFAEIIKHACIKDANLFERLTQQNIEYYMQNKSGAWQVVEENVAIKTGVVRNDEDEKGERMILNFGHSFGHAIEHATGIAHGSAVAIGMVIACKISEKITGFKAEDTNRVIRLLQQYHLPVEISVDKEKLWQALLLDKKRAGADLNFVLLNRIGEARVHRIAISELKKIGEEI